MQTAEERRAYYNEYKIKNAERIREIRRESARRQRAAMYALRPPVLFIPKPAKVIVQREPRVKILKEPKIKKVKLPKPPKIPKVKAPKVSHAKTADFGWEKDSEGGRTISASWRPHKESDYLVKTPIGLCNECYKKYLVPLGCLFCK